MLFYVLSDFGFNSLTIREVARDKSKTGQYIYNISAIKLVLGLVSLVLIILVMRILGKGAGLVNLAYFLAIYMVIDNFGNFFRSVFRAHQEMQYETICEYWETYPNTKHYEWLVDPDGIPDGDDLVCIEYDTNGDQIAGTYDDGSPWTSPTSMLLGFGGEDFLATTDTQYDQTTTYSNTDTYTYSSQMVDEPKKEEMLVH